MFDVAKPKNEVCSDIEVPPFRPYYQDANSFFFLRKAGGAKNYSFTNPDQFNDCILVIRAWF